MARSGQANETDRLISSEKVEGTAVHNRNGDRLGTVDHLMIDKFTGQVEYAVMSFAGFLGIGETYNPVPWKSLAYDVNLGGYVMYTDRAQLEKAPRYQSSGQPNCRIASIPSGSAIIVASAGSDLLPNRIRARVSGRRNRHFLPALDFEGSVRDPGMQSWYRLTYR